MAVSSHFGEGTPCSAAAGEAAGEAAREARAMETRARNEPSTTAHESSFVLVTVPVPVDRAPNESNLTVLECLVYEVKPLTKSQGKSLS